MESIKNKTVLLIDNGGCVELARRIVPDFKEVLYFNGYSGTGFPLENPHFVGTGIKGVNKIYDPFSYIDDVDLIIFSGVSSIQYGDMAEYFRSIGKRVVSAFYGQEMETDRIGLKEWMKENGLRVNRHKDITGTSKLRKFLEDHPDTFFYVKISDPPLRGLGETFAFPNLKLGLPELEKREYRLGSALKEKVTWVVEWQLEEDMIEWGTDTFFAGGKYPKTLMGGIEKKDTLYWGVVKQWDEFPKELTEINKALTPALTDYGYQHNISTECKINEKREQYLIDLTCRMPSPPSELMIYMIENLAELYWELGGGNVIEPKYKDKYGIQLIMRSTWAEDEKQPVYIDEAVRDNVFIENFTVTENVVYTLPNAVGIPSDSVGCICESGKSFADCIEKIKKIIPKVQGIHIEFPTKDLEEINEHIEKLKSWGLNIFD